MSQHRDEVPSQSLDGLFDVLIDCNVKISIKARTIGVWPT